MIPQFISGGTSGINSPEELARRRLLAQALKMQAASDQPKNLGEGIGALADAIAARRANAGLDEAAATGAESAQSAIAKALGGAGAFPAAPVAPSSSAPSTPYAGDLKSGIQSTAEALGIDPVDLGTAISYETGGTFDPTKRGPTTQWGQHKGLIQFGEPQAQKYGVDWKNPIGSQLGPDGAVAKYLRDTGVKPGMGLLDIYSAINAGRVGKYNASDAKNGGAPGTVRDKVEQQMAAHRAKALALLGGNQVASLDPGIGINPPASAVNPDPGIAAQPPMALANRDPGILANPATMAIASALNPGSAGSPAATTPGGQRVVQRMVNPAPMSGGASPMPMMGGPQQPAPDNLPVMAGGNADAIPKGQMPSIQDLMQAAQNPWLNEEQRGVVNMLLKRQMDAADPNNQLDAEYKRAQISALNAKQDALPDSVKALKERAAAAGLVEGSPEFKNFMVTGGHGPATVINTGDNSSAFAKKSDESAAKRMDDIVTAGQSAPQTMADMQQLVDLGSQIGTGKLADWKSALGPYAQAAGIDVGNMDEIQAYKAITSRLAPQMRAVGSGSSSDTDVALFMQSLPNLRNTQGGNEMIANTMKSVAQNKINAAAIARKAQRGDITWQDADEQISKLPNPYDLFKQFQKDSAKKTVIDGYTIEPVE